MGQAYAGLVGEWKCLFYQTAKGKPSLPRQCKAMPLPAKAKRNPSRHDHRLLDPAFDADIPLGSACA
jgi:hypothetical protein